MSLALGVGLVDQREGVFLENPGLSGCVSFGIS